MGYNCKLLSQQLGVFFPLYRPWSDADTSWQSIALFLPLKQTSKNHRMLKQLAVKNHKDYTNSNNAFSAQNHPS